MSHNKRPDSKHRYRRNVVYKSETKAIRNLKETAVTPFLFILFLNIIYLMARGCSGGLKNFNKSALEWGPQLKAQKVLGRKGPRCSSSTLSGPAQGIRWSAVVEDVVEVIAGWQGR
jgi:hypothetical protein